MHKRTQSQTIVFSQQNRSSKEALLDILEQHKIKFRPSQRDNNQYKAYIKVKKGQHSEKDKKNVKQTEYSPNHTEPTYQDENADLLSKVDHLFGLIEVSQSPVREQDRYIQMQTQNYNKEYQNPSSLANLQFQRTKPIVIKSTPPKKRWDINTKPNQVRRSIDTSSMVKMRNYEQTRIENQLKRATMKNRNENNHVRTNSCKYKNERIYPNHIRHQSQANLIFQNNIQSRNSNDAPLSKTKSSKAILEYNRKNSLGLMSSELNNNREQSIQFAQSPLNLDTFERRNYNNQQSNHKYINAESRIEELNSEQQSESTSITIDDPKRSVSKEKMKWETIKREASEVMASMDYLEKLMKDNQSRLSQNIQKSNAPEQNLILDKISELERKEREIRKGLFLTPSNKNLNKQNEEQEFGIDDSFRRKSSAEYTNNSNNKPPTAYISPAKRSDPLVRRSQQFIGNNVRSSLNDRLNTDAVDYLAYEKPNDMSPVFDNYLIDRRATSSFPTQTQNLQNQEEFSTYVPLFSRARQEETHNNYSRVPYRQSNKTQLNQSKLQRSVSAMLKQATLRDKDIICKYDSPYKMKRSFSWGQILNLLDHDSPPKNANDYY